MKKLVRFIIGTAIGMFATAALHAAGNLKVTLNPAAAVSAGARWRVDGGSWQASGATLKLNPGTHTVDFNAVIGWIAPTSTNTSVVNGSTTTINATYVQAANVSITLSPSTGQWRLDGGAWQSSAAVVGNVAPGNHAIEYLPLNFYQAPANETVTLAAGQSLSLQRTYTQLSQILISLSPSAGQWRANGGAWQASGASLWVLPGTYNIDYSPLDSYDSPTPEAVTFSAPGSVFVTTRYYTPSNGSLHVDLNPVGAQWRVDGGAWQSSGTTLTLPRGSHTVDYSAITGYAIQGSETVTIVGGQLLSYSRSYTQLGQISVVLNPSSALWRVDGGAWLASGAVSQYLAPGDHMVEYASLAGYISPATESATVTGGQVLTLTRSYIQRPQITITLSPSAAQWRIDGGNWLASGVTASNLAEGSHTIDYSALAGYSAPPSEVITLTNGQPLTLNRSYTQLAQVTVTLTPSNAQWRVDGGAWLASAATSDYLAPGAHTIDYNAVVGYITPSTESVTLVSGQTLGLNRAYLQEAQLTVTLDPAYAQWRIDGGDWLASGATATHLAPTSHTLDYVAVANYDAPPSETLSLGSGENASITRSYTPHPAQVTITVTPTTGQWRVYPILETPSGAWNASGATVGGLLPGRYAIDWSDVAGYNKPGFPTAFDLTAGQQLSISQSYTPIPPRIQVSLSPDYGRFRVNGGDWNLPDTIVTVPSPGSYLVEFSDVTGYYTPAPQTVAVDWGDLDRLNITYTPIPPATLTVKTSPDIGQFRVNGGAWWSSGTTFNQLNAGTYLIEYSSIANYLTPSAQTVTLNPGDVKEVDVTYAPAATLTVRMSPTSAQWRVDGGAWTDNGATVGSLAAGDHRIDYSDVFGYIVPASDTVTLSEGENKTWYATYMTGAATLQVNLDPTAGRWRSDGGSWYNSGDSVMIGSGAHTLEFEAIGGYSTPPAESITLGVDETRSVSRTYAQIVTSYNVVKTFLDAGSGPTLIRGSDGALYVATSSLGNDGAGQVVRINTDGTGYTVVKGFPSITNGALAPNSLIEGHDGVLYGTTANGGVNTNNGTAFKVNKDGTGYTLLHSFDTTYNGTSPNAIIEGSDGALYGTTSLGGGMSNGVIFRMNKDGSNYTIVYWAYGSRGIIEGLNGTLYGTTTGGYFGGTGGSVFKVNRDGTGFTVLKNLNGTTDGATPKAVPLLATDGLLYGTTSAGGSANKGVVYRINPDGTGFTVLRNFLGDSTDGGRLDAPLTEGPDGVLYGATFGGGSSNRGTVFCMNKDGSGYAILRHFTGGVSDGGVLSNRVVIGADGTLYGVDTFGGGDTRGLLFRMNSDGSNFANLLDFGAPNGSVPKWVTEASDGTLYGVTYLGGGYGKGTVFKVNKDGTGFSVLHRVAGGSDGAMPVGHVIEASDGMIYGTTSGGNPPNGTLFRLNKDGTGYAILHTFSASGDAQMPYSGVTEASDGVLYGATLMGGSNGGYGAVYRVNKDGSGYALLHSFANASTEGNTPVCRLLEGPTGLLYGTANSAGANNCGTVFAISKDGATYTVLHTFAGGTTDGAGPATGLCLAGDGRLYGVTSSGGTGGKGTVFGLNLDGTGYAVLKQFSGGADGGTPYYGSVVERNGMLLGTTNVGGSFNGGTVFTLNRDGTAFAVLVNFGIDESDGRAPSGTLWNSTDGALYGTTHYGAQGGVVFKLQLQ
jgi:uncharacterized repeat protein (TIGR03803 family)